VNNNYRSTKFGDIPFPATSRKASSYTPRSAGARFMRAKYEESRLAGIGFESSAKSAKGHW